MLHFARKNERYGSFVLYIGLKYNKNQFENNFFSRYSFFYTSRQHLQSKKNTTKIYFSDKNVLYFYNICVCYTIMKVKFVNIYKFPL